MRRIFRNCLILLPTVPIPRVFANPADYSKREPQILLAIYLRIMQNDDQLTELKGLSMDTPLRELRAKRGYTLAEVVEGVKKFGISTDTGNLSRIERGEQMANIELATALVKFYRGAITEMEIIYPHKFDAPEGGAERTA